MAAEPVTQPLTEQREARHADLDLRSTQELVELTRHHGYRLDELVEIIEDVG